MTKKRGGVVLLILIAVLIVGAFAFVAYRTPETAEEATEVTEKDELMSKNIAANDNAYTRILYIHPSSANFPNSL